MSTFYKPFVVFIFLMGGLLPNLSLAAPRAADGNSKALAKLQAMVKEANVERDLLKTEASKMTAEIEQLKKDIASKSSNEERVSGELAAQKSSNAQVASTLQQTHAKLLEIIEKHNAINQSKNELSALHNDLKMSHTLKETELQNCESKNIKLYEQNLPTGKIGNPKEIGKFVKFVVESKIKYLNGSSIYFDGNINKGII